MPSIRFRRRLPVLLALPLLFGRTLAEPFGIDHYLALGTVDEIAVSPDGSYVAYTLSTKDLDEDAYTDAVWVQPADGSDAFRVSAKGAGSTSPQWSPDGRYLAVLSDRDEDISQIWLYDRRGGDAQALTALPQGIDSYQWAPDSQKLLFVAEDATPADLDEEEPPNPRPWVVDRLQFKEDYTGYLDRYRTHVYVVDLASREPAQVTFGDYEDSEPAWAPDSRHIAFVSNRTPEPDSNRNTELWIVDTAAKPGTAPRQLTSSDAAEASPSWSPDGRTIACTSTVPGALPIYAIPRPTLVDVATGAMRHFDAFPETAVYEPRFSADGEAIFGYTESGGEQELVRIDTASGRVTRLTGGGEVVTDYDIGPDDALYAVVAMPQAPGEIFALRPDGLQKLSRVNDAVLAGFSPSRVEKHNYRSSDGTLLDTFVVFPPDYKPGRKYPGLLYIHGGPMAQWDARFESESRLLAGRGYVVILPNPRGSWGYGQAFAEAIYRDWGGIDYDDVMASMDFAIDKGWVDPKRTAVYGWSYGGMMTNHVITKTDRFRAAITGASATLYVANYGHDQYQRWWEEELGLPWLAENREHWDKITPFWSLDKVVTPTLVVGGEDDWNVPIQNSEQLYIALKRRGVPTELVVYPGEGHILSVPSYERHLYEQYFRWLDRYVTGKEDGRLRP